MSGTPDARQAEEHSLNLAENALNKANKLCEQAALIKENKTTQAKVSRNSAHLVPCEFSCL